MASTVKVPLLGTQSTGTVIGVTIGGVVVSGYMLYHYSAKNKKQAAAAATAQTQAQAASGYGVAYGYGNGYYGYGEVVNSPYGYGASGGFAAGYYGYGVPNPPTVGAVANTTNAQWAQAAITQLSQDGYDTSSIAAALGAYELGAPVTATQQGIIQAAIAVEGYPPVSGANGDPPGINVQGTPGGGTGGGQGGGGTGGSVSVPNVVGQRANNGIATLKAAGFQTTTSPFRNPLKTYIITAQNPSGSAASGSLVTLTVAVHSY
jgi:hypothetical protein